MSRASRKLEHLKYAIETGQTGVQGFENVHFVHQALPEVALSQTSIATSIGGLQLSSPIIINAMTGGAYETVKINQHLAALANELNLVMAVGSQMSAIKNKEYRSTYQIVRGNNPKGIIFANLGADATPEQANEAIEMIEADGIQIHINVIQELTMPEGDRDFTGILDRLQAIKESVKIPFIVKEVGFGMSKEVVFQLVKRGIKIIDVGGRGGTNFALIENKRRLDPYPFFNDWGIHTATSILEATTVNKTEIIATGGIQNSLHIAKAIGLGANAVGMSGMILRKLVNEGFKQTLGYVNQLHHEIKLIMTSLGAVELLDLQKKPMVILGETKDWCELRGIPINELARREFL
ncbi:type 2 isopentenyl-diphosphate Delta-isomerase [Tepidibacillus decaturensis]|uniref:Isopentenyl-diphosphate delta-isomerase n=1 Tax=Tepidibacillus decaturensis TaxID=1413211 RepID=A0A135L3W5_9BACI|nr:type 2 isopentenyl-diphosphate Delta-isomerase [Tepidibacillus decaturensis]KXG43650.1 type 2 isopentenyl-diphosphate Delta-isomerase [Tepidibacillus decaturensis]